MTDTRLNAELTATVMDCLALGHPMLAYAVFCKAKSMCTYCKTQLAFHKDSSFLYNKPSGTYGAVYVCQKEGCGARVGAHKSTKAALGSVSLPRLRSMRCAAHDAFDRLWKNGRMSRNTAYKALSDALNTPAEATHIALFGFGLAAKTIVWAIHEAHGEDNADTYIQPLLLRYNITAEHFSSALQSRT